MGWVESFYVGVLLGALGACVFCAGAWYGHRISIREADRAMAELIRASNENRRG